MGGSAATLTKPSERGLRTRSASSSNDLRAAGQPSAGALGYGFGRPALTLGGAVQRKVAVGRPGDPYEREADAASDRIQRGDSVGNVSTVSRSAFQPLVQRQSPLTDDTREDEAPSEIVQACGSNSCDCSPAERAAKESGTPVDDSGAETEIAQLHADPQHQESATKGDVSVADVLQECASGGCEAKLATDDRQPDRLVQGSRAEGGTAPGMSAVTGALGAPAGGGQPLEAGVRAPIERGIGVDLGDVRVHEGATATRANKALGARAFTNGRDIWLASGESSSDLGLIAHESTHVVQQGGAGSIAPAQGAGIVQRSCDEQEPAGRGDQAAGAETAAPVAGCRQMNDPAEQPPEGTEEPQEAETPAGAQANAGAPVDHRQANAPPVDQGAPAPERGIAEGAARTAEAPQGPCEVREAAAHTGDASSSPGPRIAGQAPAGASSTGGSVAAPQPATSSQTSTPPRPPGVQPSPAPGATDGSSPAGGAGGAGTEATPTGPGTTSRPVGASGGGQNAFLEEAIASARLAPDPAGSGEAASPVLAAERDQLLSGSDEALAAFDDTSASISAVSEAVTYRATGQPIAGAVTKASEMASTFLADGGAQVASFMDEARQRIDALRDGNEVRKDAVLADVDRQRTTTRSVAAAIRADVRGRAAVATARIESRHARILATIEARAERARSRLGPMHDEKQRAILRAGVAASSRLDGAYRTGYDQVKAVGTDKGSAAVRRAGRHSNAYLTAEGQSPEIVRRVTGPEKDGFWDGYLTYNRYKARAEAATEVGKQYSEGFEKEATKQADKLLCGKARDAEILGAMVGGGTRTLGCARDNGIDSIERQRRQAVELAESSHRTALRTIRQSLAATLAQLGAREASQLALLNDWGVRQSLALERDAERARSAVIQGTSDAAANLIEYLSSFRAQVEAASAPRPETLSGQLTAERRRFADALARAEAATANRSKAPRPASRPASTRRRRRSSRWRTSAWTSLASWETDSAEASEISSRRPGGIRPAEAAYVERITGDLANSTQILEAVVTGVKRPPRSGQRERRGPVRRGRPKTGEGFQQSLDRDFDQKVCSAAEKAAADVQPWWKTALKILLIIVIIVVVAFVIGPAVIGAVGAAATSLAGSLGAGAALAGTIGAWVGPIVGGAIVGALAGAATQVGSNAIYGKPLTEGLRGAIIAGAVGGALGGLGGQLGQVLVGRIASTAFSRIAVQYGTEAVFDVVGNVVGDLAAGNPITFESVAMAFAIGTAAKLGVAGVGRVATTRAEVTAPGAAEPTTFGERVASGRVGRAAESLHNLQKGSMAFGERVGARAGSFGPRGMTAAATTEALAGARARIEAGEAFPTRPRVVGEPEPAASGGTTGSTKAIPAGEEPVAGRPRIGHRRGWCRRAYVQASRRRVNAARSSPNGRGARVRSTFGSRRCCAAGGPGPYDDGGGGRRSQDRHWASARRRPHHACEAGVRCGSRIDHHATHADRRRRARNGVPEGRRACRGRGLQRRLPGGHPALATSEAGTDGTRPEGPACQAHGASGADREGGGGGRERLHEPRGCDPGKRRDRRHAPGARGRPPGAWPRDRRSHEGLSSIDRGGRPGPDSHRQPRRPHRQDAGGDVR